MTQGHTKKEAFEMVADMLESLVNKKDFKVKIFIKSKNSFECNQNRLNSGDMTLFFDIKCYIVFHSLKTRKKVYCRKQIFSQNY